MTTRFPQLQLKRSLFLLASLLIAALLLAACNGGSGKATGGKGGAKSNYPPPQSPGVEFTKTSVGLPSMAMDFIGMNDIALAGAKKGRMVFYAVQAGEGRSDVYVRDLRSGQRAKVATLDRLVPSTLTADQAGKQLVYCRLRETAKYIDDPGIDTPTDVSVPYRYDLDKKEETALFDFREPDWLPYRNGNLIPVCSNDGERVACLGYNNDLSIIGYTCDRWLKDYALLKGGKSGLSPDEMSTLKKGMQSVFSGKVFATQMKSLGLEHTAGAEPNEADKAAIIKLRDSLPPPQWVIMLWDKGVASRLPLKLDSGAESLRLSLAAISKSELVLASGAADPTMAAARYFTVSSDGSLKPLLELKGVPTHLSLDEASSSMMLVYTPATADGKSIEGFSSFMRIPLDGTTPQEQRLENNYGSTIDLSSDGKVMLAQDQFDRDLYLVDLSSGSRERLMDFVSGSDVGVFLPDGSDQGVFLENGILFRFDIPEDPQNSGQWRSSELFKEYDAKAREFLAQLGFTPGEGADSSWEGREGIGLNEYGGVVFDPSHPDSIALLRYNLQRKQVDSLYFPNGYNMIAAPELNRGPVDAFGAEEVAKAALDKAGWLGPNAQQYQPGSSAIYDSKSDSFVFIYRDGYNLPNSGPWVINREATIRVGKSTGQIAEMNLASSDPVNDPKLTASDEMIQTGVRNFKDTPLPPQAKVKIDTANKRLVVVRPRETKLGPAAYAMQQAPKIYYEVDVFEEQGGLIWTSRVDTESGEVLDQLYYMPSGQSIPTG